jgi:hypothetical protein
MHAVPYVILLRAAIRLEVSLHPEEEYIYLFVF